jgi:hypothetical protein
VWNGRSEYSLRREQGMGWDMETSIATAASTSSPLKDGMNNLPNDPRSGRSIQAFSWGQPASKSLGTISMRTAIPMWSGGWATTSDCIGSGNRWTKEEIDKTFSQVHALHLADFDGDGEQEFVTGKRVYAHAVEPGATDAPCIYIFRFDRAKRGWSKTTVYLGEPAPAAPLKPEQRNALKDFRPGSAGTGLRLALHDMDRDGDVDIVAPGKSGLYWFENPNR